MPPAGRSGLGVSGVPVHGTLPMSKPKKKAPAVKEPAKEPKKTLVKRGMGALGRR